MRPLKNLFLAEFCNVTWKNNACENNTTRKTGSFRLSLGKERDDGAKASYK